MAGTRISMLESVSSDLVEGFFGRRGERREGGAARFLPFPFSETGFACAPLPLATACSTPSCEKVWLSRSDSSISARMAGDRSSLAEPEGWSCESPPPHVFASRILRSAACAPRTHQLAPSLAVSSEDSHQQGYLPSSSPSYPASLLPVSRLSPAAVAASSSSRASSTRSCAPPSLRPPYRDQRPHQRACRSPRSLRPSNRSPATRRTRLAARPVACRRPRRVDLRVALA